MWVDALSYHIRKSATWVSFTIPRSHLRQISNPSLNLRNFCCPKAISRPLLSGSAAETFICVFIISCLDSTDGALFVLPNKALDKLQYVQNSAVTVLTRKNGQVPYFLCIPSCPCSTASDLPLRYAASLTHVPQLKAQFSSLTTEEHVPLWDLQCPISGHFQKKQMKDVIYWLKIFAFESFFCECKASFCSLKLAVNLSYYTYCFYCLLFFVSHCFMSTGYMRWQAPGNRWLIIITTDWW